MELTVSSLYKDYGAKAALRDVSFTLTPGIYGLLGPNGSGKSTLMGIITGNLKQTSGTVLWDGKDIGELGGEYRAILGYVPQHHSLYPEFTASRFLYYMAALKGMTKAEADLQVPEALELVELTAVAKDKVKTFSGGMRQRLAIAQAVLSNPSLLVMDEPTVGLDPYQRETVRKMIVGVAEQKVVLVSTHVVSDIEWISKEVLLLKEGELVRQGSRESLVGEVAGLVPEELKPKGRPLGLEDVYLYFYGEEHGEADLL
ncbi:MAG: ATP-binding cassette domain-containing protein [Coriobacteriia bacterium]|nr:ATP-binding cassette domain-containing protein [Coriobacteriia bacterium]